MRHGCYLVCHARVLHVFPLFPLYLLRRLSPALQSPLDTIPRSSVLEPLYRWPSVAIHRPPSALTRLSARKPARLSGFNAPAVQGRRTMMALLGPSCPDAAPTVRLAAAHAFWGKDPTNGLTKRLATSSNLLRRDLNQLFYIPKKIEKSSRLARPRLYNAGAFYIHAHAAARGGTPGRPRQDFRFDFLTRSMRRNSPQTARAATKEVPRC